MSNLFSGINARIRGTAKAGTSAKVSSPSSPNPEAVDSQAEIPTSTSGGLQVSLPESSSLSESIGAASNGDYPRPLPLWLNPSHTRHIVKGNFLTLSARPKTVEQGEWVAHQVVEHYRNLMSFARIVHEKEEDGSTICNATTCPTMSAGKNHSYTWLNKNNQPVELPAHEYMSLVQRWVSGKIDDPALFPTDPAGVSFARHPDFADSALLARSGGEDWFGARSGFPKQFPGTCQLIFRQIFRVYAHLYWAHFVDPFYHLDLEKSLNSCFSHFILTATTLDMLKQSDLEPMQYLIDLWAADGTFPAESRAYSYANVERGRSLLKPAATQ